MATKNYPKMSSGILGDERFHELVNAIYDVWQAISPDVEGCDSVEEKIELCLDANRLTTFGHEASEKYLEELEAQYGHEQVDKFLAREVDL